MTLKGSPPLSLTVMSYSYVQSLFDKASASSDKAEVVACLSGLDRVAALEACFWGQDSDSAHSFEVGCYWDLSGDADMDAV